jgi:hypothetical protein
VAVHIAVIIEQGSVNDFARPEHAFLDEKALADGVGAGSGSMDGKPTLAPRL